MPIQEFLLTPTGDHAIQVHWSSPPAAAGEQGEQEVRQNVATVMLNRSILGSFATAEERVAGKDFTLPDSSLLHVQFFEDKPLAWRNGQPLYAPPANIQKSRSINPADRKRGVWMTAWLIINLAFVGWYTLIYFMGFLASMVKDTADTLSFAFLLFGLLGCIGIAGLSLLLAWKKSGFYLLAGYVVCGFVLDLIFRLWDIRSFGPLVATVILYFWMQRTNVWDYLT